MPNIREFISNSSAKIRERAALKPITTEERTRRRDTLGITPKTSISNDIFEQNGERKPGRVNINYHVTEAGHALLESAAKLVHDGTQVKTTIYQPILSMPEGRHRVQATNQRNNGSRPELTRFTDTTTVLVDLVDGVRALPRLSPRRKTIRAVKEIKNIRAGQQGK